MASPTDRRPVLVGANPGLQLFDNGTCTAFASVWHVDWSTHGSGAALVLWLPESVTVTTTDEALGRWLTTDFVRHFPELDGLTWTDPQIAVGQVDLAIDLASGVRARAGEVAVEIGEVLDVREFATDDFTLGTTAHSLRLVLGPCGIGSITVAGTRLPGEPDRGGTPERPASSAYIAVAEVWRA